MNDSYDTGGRVTMEKIATKQPYELLLMLGGALAILLTLVLTGLQWYPKIPTGTVLQTEAVTLVINVVLGAALYVSAAIVRKNLINGAIVAGVVSVILLAYGGQAGTISGIVGILGAILAAASPYMPKSRQH
ncbi:MAG: hypothetical protein E6K08_02665 [Methanobacteriota archaeon]|nr:MAG: hypothetical protein E6K08_02665 [Euryarchaeota archaeon]TLZ78957.1 MAG: hypothetical protein E6K11_07850 [Euryarchaeota archaeon]